MSNKQITFNDWLKLSKKEKSEQYRNLNDHDKFLVRMGEYYFDGDENTKPLTREEKDKIAMKLAKKGILVIADSEEPTK